MGVWSYLWPFEKKFQDIPCARESCIYAQIGGVGVGAVHFMFTSQVRRSCHVAVGSGILILWISFFICRYQDAQLRIRSKAFEDTIKSNK